MAEKLGGSLRAAMPLALVILIGAVGYLYAKAKADKEIARVTTERDLLREQKASIDSLAAVNDSLKEALSQVRLEMLQEVFRRQVVVDSLERGRQAARLTVRRLRRTEEVARKFAETYPEVAHSAWGFHDVYDEDNDIEIEYISIPSRLVETFMIEHSDANSLVAQRDTLQSIVELQEEVRVLSDSMLTLETANRTAYEQGFRAAFTNYENVVDRYVQELKKPDFEFRFPNVALLLGSFAAGVAVAK